MQKQESVLESSVMRRTLSAVLLLLALAGAGCAQNRIVYAQSGVQVQPPQYPSYQGSYTNGVIPSAWLPCTSACVPTVWTAGFAGALRLNGYAVAGSHGPQDQGAVHQGLRLQRPKPNAARPSKPTTAPTRPKPLVLSRVITRRERGEMPGLP